MNPEIHKLYTELSHSTVAHQKMLTIRNVHQLEHFVKTHYKCLFADEIDTYNRSFDYRYGIWYKKIFSLQVYYNVLEHHINVALHTRIVDNRFVDRTIPVIKRKRLRPRDIVCQLETVLKPHVRVDALVPLQTALHKIDNQLKAELSGLQKAVHLVLNRRGMPYSLCVAVLDFVY